MQIVQIPRRLFLRFPPVPPPRPQNLNSSSMNFIRQFFASPAPSEAMSAAKVKAQNIINENAVASANKCASFYSLTAVFSKSWCPHCAASKRLLDNMGAKYYAIELDQVSDGRAIQDALAELSGQRTVPNIYIGQQHIGGNSDLQAKSGELKAMLKEVGAA
ncbi:putative glutaredoxin [Xylaria sp. CBS 124048]|nr:putative glutaredoxin [Xylaria sp. CBS 124048]